MTSVKVEVEGWYGLLESQGKREGNEASLCFMNVFDLTDSSSDLVFILAFTTTILSSTMPASCLSSMKII